MLESLGWGWVDFTRSINAVTLFGRGFGDLIRPAEPQSLCPDWQTLPVGKYYLAASAIDLMTAMKIHGTRYSNPPQLVHGLSWNSPALRPYAKAEHANSHKDCDPVQLLLPPFFNNVLRTQQPAIADDQNSTAAFVFGHSFRYPFRWPNDGMSLAVNVEGHSESILGDSESEYSHAGNSSSSGSRKTESSVLSDSTSVFSGSRRAESFVLSDITSVSSTEPVVTTRLTKMRLFARKLVSSIRKGKDNESGGHETKKRDEEESNSETEDFRTTHQPHRPSRSSLEHLDTLLTQDVIPELRSGPVDTTRVSHPIEQTLETEDTLAIEQILSERFDEVATGKYEWLRDITSIGYSFSDMACLLLEQKRDSPWIYFEPHRIELPVMDCQIHLPNCAHESFNRSNISSRTGPGSFPHSTDGPERPSTGTHFAPADNHETLRKVQELCGLAGIVPVSRDKQSWNGTVEFADGNATAAISYPSTSENLSSTKSLLTSILEGLCAAASCLQSRGLCCDSFTILHLVETDLDQDRQQKPIVEASRVCFTTLRTLREAVDGLGTDKFMTQEECALEILSNIFRPGHQQIKNFKSLGPDGLLAIVVQFLCVGFLSYSQAHIGKLRPFFLETPIQKTQLLGSRKSKSQPYIEGGLIELTCFGDMVGKPVFAFSLPLAEEQPQSRDSTQAHDLLTNLEDLVDTWGPGHFVVSKEKRGLPVALVIGEGILTPVDPESTMFHWSRDFQRITSLETVIDPQAKVTIGTSVSVNERCVIDETVCWKKSEKYMKYLGTGLTRWEVIQRQLNAQLGGEFGMVQVGATQSKVHGQSIKDSNLTRRDRDLISLFNDPFGLQVSFCTGVSRRVTLGEMVADLMPIFARSTLRADVWRALQLQDVVQRCRSGSAGDFVDDLDADLKQAVLGQVRCIFDELAKTGVDPSGKFMIVAWPQPENQTRCFWVPCERRSAWTKILADTHDCATFAYITARCLETDAHLCQRNGHAQGHIPRWRNEMPVMETAVGRVPAELAPSSFSSSSSSTSSSSSSSRLDLRHDARYFFQKINDRVFFTVRRLDATATAELVMGNYNLWNVPLEIWARISTRLNEELRRKARLCERSVNEVSSESVSLYVRPQ